MNSRAATGVQNDASRRSALLLVAIFLAAGFVAALSVPASGQQPQYEVWELDPKFDKYTDEKGIKSMKSSLRGLATTRDLSSYSGSNAALWFARTYVPAQLTNPKAMGDMPDLVGSVLDAISLADRTTSSSGAGTAIKTAVALGMRKVAEGNYHPPGRITALMILGRLDEQAVTPQTPPVPLRSALPILLNIYQDEANVDGVRAAALQGIHHHVKARFSTFSDQERNSIRDAMTKLLDSPAPETRDPLAHAYLQRFAVDILSLLNQPNDKDFASKLVSISAAPDRPNLIALYSASRAGQMGDAIAGNVEVSVLDRWNLRLLAAFKAEIDRLAALDRPENAKGQPIQPKDALSEEKEERVSSAGVGGYGAGYGGDEMMDEGDMAMDEDMGMEGYGGMMGDMMGMVSTPTEKPQPPEIMASRRYLNHVLEQLHLAVAGSPKPGLPSKPGGLLAAVGDVEKTVVETWLTSMQTVLESLNDGTLQKRDKFIQMLEEQIAIIEDLTDLPPDDGRQNEGAAEVPVASIAN